MGLRGLLAAGSREDFRPGPQRRQVPPVSDESVVFGVRHHANVARQQAVHHPALLLSHHILVILRHIAAVEVVDRFVLVLHHPDTAELQFDQGNPLLQEDLRTADHYIHD